MGPLSAETVFLFLLFALPGAVAIRVYMLYCPMPQKDWKESIGDAVVYSMVGLAGWFLLVPSTIRRFVEGVTQRSEAIEAGSRNKAVGVILDYGWELILYTLVTPAVLSLVWYLIRLGIGHQYGKFDHPIRTAWDWAFSRTEPVYVYFCLKARNKDGKQDFILGWFNGKSYVTRYPHDPEVFVERIHEMKPDGTPGDPVLDTAGMFIKLSECERLEFLIDPDHPPTTFLQRRLRPVKRYGRWSWGRAARIGRWGRDRTVGCGRWAKVNGTRAIVFTSETLSNWNRRIQWRRNRPRVETDNDQSTTDGQARP